MSIKHRILGITVLFATFVLTACGSFTVDDARLQVALSPEGNLGYEINDEGVITITTRAFTFRNPAGAAALQLTRASITFITDTGAILEGEPTSLNVFVPAGLTCDELVAGTAGPEGCTLSSTNWEVATGPLVQTDQTYQMLDASIAIEHVSSANPTAWRAEVVFEGREVSGRPFTSEPYPFMIVAPN